jgi:uncharacterized protein YbjT (DUF2867 family)
LQPDGTRPLKNSGILVTGASGYIGARLIPRLLGRGYRVRCLVREAERLEAYPWSSQVEIRRVNLTAGPSIQEALDGISAAYYLVHSMASGRRYHPLDLSAARNFASAAGRSGLGQIIYLGGLADPSERIGHHMRSRIQTGEVLRQGGIPVTEFRAGVIVGRGSISFEMIRYLTEQLPILVGPRWLSCRVQPIAVQDVLAYLLSALESPDCLGGTFEIGGPDVMTYAEAMLAYARVRGLKRVLLALPGVPLGLMAYGVDRLTPVPATIASPLIDSMRSDSIVRDEAARRVFADIQPLGYETAIRMALAQLSPAEVYFPFSGRQNRTTIVKQQGFLIDDRQVLVEVEPGRVYRAVIGLGGDRGWLYWNWLWHLRGLLDRWVGGPGMRGREKGSGREVGDIVDFYRVEALEPERLYRLRAELKSPGEGWMEWSLKPSGPRRTILRQKAYFAPRGVPGYLYWYCLYPVHALVFAGLIRGVIHQSFREQPEGD